MCECLNTIVETAVCVQAGALVDADSPSRFRAVAAWADHDHHVDVAMARSAPLHYTVALINVPRGGAAASWLVAELARILTVEESCGLHPAWRAYGGLWLAQMAAIVALRSTDPSVAEQALTVAREAVEAVGGVCADSLHAPATDAELERYPFAWLDCDGALTSIPSAMELHLGARSLPAPPSEIDDLSPLVLGLQTMSTDEWRNWPSASLVRRIHADA
ncbi:hypothetical protein F0U44_18570 [Nocardioides humilatus]|uniref:Uncharacterized protein n=1 Tax=Nocardioides humilatus TaxID=2607660 RepID=A0A5B1L6K3_9ACTN|nr:hypothetical protein [Nocardioides humilatus]KAA1416331.1 hypothetical protein F0U44_18570 [Nocardioides humilatus]